MNILNRGTHFQTSIAQTILLKTENRNLDNFFKDTAEICKESQLLQRTESILLETDNLTQWDQVIVVL